MAYAPISGIIPQFSNAANELASGYYLKFYIANTTTPLSMATDSTGSTLLAKCKLNTDGMPISNEADNTTVFIPYVNQAYRMVIYTNSTDADANTTGSAFINIPNNPYLAYSEIVGDAATSAAAALVSETNAAASEAATAADVVLTNADVVSTNADAAATAADVILTAADVVTTGNNVIAAQAAQTAAEAANSGTQATYIEFDARYLGTKSADPTVDNLGAALVEGAFYFNDVSNRYRDYRSSVWGNMYAGTAATKDTGIGADQLPKNSDLPSFGTASEADVTTSNADTTAGALLTVGAKKVQLDLAGSLAAADLDGGQTGGAPIFGARAWANFTGTGAVAIRDSGNVTSITDNGIGNYTVNFTTALQDTNYAPVVSTVAGSSDIYASSSVISTTAVVVACFGAGAPIDRSSIHLSVFR